jgi:hypothetical protein
VSPEARILRFKVESAFLFGSIQSFRAKSMNGAAGKTAISMGRWS